MVGRLKMATALAGKQPFHEYFWGKLASADNSVLLLDYDQTISLFCMSRDDGSSSPSIRDLLHAIMTRGRTRVILISELRAVEVVALLQMSPGPEIWGSRGLERRMPNGNCEVLDIGAGAERALAVMDLSLEAQGLGRLTEVQPGAIVVRWSGLGWRVTEEVRERVSEAWSAVRDLGWLSTREFEGGIEFRIRFWEKSDAVEQLVYEVGAGIPVAYLGDEKSDEDAFRALKCRGLCVLVRAKFIATAADLWLQPPDDVVQFLADWVRARAGDA